MDQTIHDHLDLATMGYKQAFSRKFNQWSMLALAFNILGTWATLAYDLGSGLANGGPVCILWGLCSVTLCNICVAISLGELCSSMPTTLGQAYWIFRLWEHPVGRFVSYICAWINTFGWWAATASQAAFMTNFMFSIKSMINPRWQGASGWLLFVVYLGITLLFTIVNAIACRKDGILPWFNNIVAVQFGILFVAFTLAILISVGIRPNLRYQTAPFVFGQWLNLTGWPDGIVWFIGLREAAYSLSAFDCVIHMAEEIPAPRTNIPRVLYLVVIIGALTGFLFMIACLFSIQDLYGILQSPTGLPFTELATTTVGLNGAVALMILFEINGLGQGVSVMTATSRLTWGFCRDGGLPWGDYLTHIDSYWNSPLRVLCADTLVISLIGLLYLFSKTALQAVVSASTIALTVSYGLPILTLVLVGRDKLPSRRFDLGRWGYLVNWISVVYCCIITVFFFFPETPNPSSNEMNYAIAAFGIMLVVSVVLWFIQGKRFYLKEDRMMQETIRAENLLPATQHIRSDQIRFYLETDRTRLAASRLLALWSMDPMRQL
ncbi:hypothetical protein N7481_011162 [Penicillium waksmanii]|uniref:uncharacterized protein n=1 Tax=Penicillium waksmanii TaxID=69791 RepID=UPI0025469F53|nr:uncharacterized protein N7481_011162 [Penicillium waksmanii]KAJ5973952.1 hypothetical protein N7481_011162 [Penicillium waksmanii]